MGGIKSSDVGDRSRSIRASADFRRDVAASPSAAATSEGAAAANDADAVPPPAAVSRATARVGLPPSSWSVMSPMEEATEWAGSEKDGGLGTVTAGITWSSSASTSSGST